MATISWRPESGGEVQDVSTAENPCLFQLASNATGTQQFNASGDLPPASVLGTIRTGSYFALYVETTTSRGRRQFKFVPTNDEPELRFGYRYEVGLGTSIRTSQLQPFALNLASLASQVESGTQINSVDRIFVRTSGTVDIEIASQTTPQPGGISSTEAARFLLQTTFGPTTDSIRELQDVGSYEAWIDQQFNAPISRTLPYVKANSNGSLSTTRHHIWFDNTINGADQLRQRIAFAWSELFVISDLDYVLSNSQYSVSQYYDMLAELGLGNFRTLLEAVTLHPSMGVYLSMLANEKADPARYVRPDENFAREVVQLFTIGLYELDSNGQVRTSGGQPIPTYEQETIEEFARVFTGWNYDGQRTWYETNAGFQNKEAPMVPYEEFHDTGEKRLLNGTVLPAGRTARQDLEAALDNIFEHPNVGPFIARHLIQRLVTSNPTPAYIGRVAGVFNNDGSGERGNIEAVVKAVLLDAEARSGHESNSNEFGKLREPVLRLTQLFRAFDAQPGPIADGIYVPRGRSIDRIDQVVGQAVLKSRSVFNFFYPDNPIGPDTEAVSPELQILSEINVASTNNMFFDQIYGFHNRSEGYGAVSRLQVEREVDLADDPEELVDHLDLLLTAGALPPSSRQAIRSHLRTIPDDADGRFTRALDAIYLIVGSPFHLVQK